MLERADVRVSIGCPQRRSQEWRFCCYNQLMPRLWTRSLWRTVDGTWIPHRRRYACGFGLISIQRLSEYDIWSCHDAQATVPPSILSLHMMFLRLPTSSFSLAWCCMLHRFSFPTSHRRHITSAGKRGSLVSWWTRCGGLFSYLLCLFCVREMMSNYGVMGKRYLWMLLCNTVVNIGPWTTL